MRRELRRETGPRRGSGSGRQGEELAEVLVDLQHVGRGQFVVHFARRVNLAGRSTDLKGPEYVTADDGVGDTTVLARVGVSG